MFAYGFESGGGRCGPGRRGVRGRHGFSGAPFEFGGGHAFGGWGRGPRGRGRKARRGDARTAALLLLAEEPRNGYQIMQELEERSEGLWRPSPGSVYPALQQLEDEALIKDQGSEAAGEDRRRMYTLTEEGQAYVTEHADELKASWDAVTGSVNDTEVQLRHTIHQVMVAVSQVAQAGSAAQVQQAGKILADTRRALYRILATDGEDTEEDSQG